VAADRPTSGTRYAHCRQGRLPLSELAAARARASCEDKGRRFALSVRQVTAQSGDQGAGGIAVGISA